MYLRAATWEPCWREGRRSAAAGPGMAAGLQASQPRTKAVRWASATGGGGWPRTQHSLDGLWLSAGASQEGLCWPQEDSLGATPKYRSSLPQGCTVCRSLWLHRHLSRGDKEEKQEVA